VVFQTGVKGDYLGIAMGTYLFSMGLFGLGCAGGNCAGGNCEVPLKKIIQTLDVAPKFPSALFFVRHPLRIFEA
jgi:hypothetical protein